MTDKNVQTALTAIGKTTSADELRALADNARRLGNAEVERAACLRLYEILPASKPGTLEYDVWRSIHGLEHTLTVERGRTTRLARTRQTITKIGELETVERLLVKKQASEGFQMLLERNMAELTFEAVALRHTGRFTAEVLNAARERLQSAGIAINTAEVGHAPD